MTNQINIGNYQPIDSLNLTINVPAGSNTAVTPFLKSFNFSFSNFNVISRVKVVIDTSGIYNVTSSEVVIVGVTPVTVLPGYYTPTDISSLLSVTIPLSGPNAFRTTNTQNLTFEQGSEVSFMLGYSNVFPTTGFTVLAGTLSPFLSNFVGAFDIINIQTNLANLANAIGNNYVTTLLVSPAIVGQSILSSETCHKPVILNSMSELTVALFDRFNNPYVLMTPITVIFTIDIYNKKHIL